MLEIQSTEKIIECDFGEQCHDTGNHQMTGSNDNRATTCATEEGCSEAKELHRKFRKLVEQLGESDERLESGSMIDIATGTNFADRSAAKRMAMMCALDAVSGFLSSEGIHSKALHQLWYDLQQLRLGVTPGALSAKKPQAGRRPDSFKVSELKGRMAGIARLRIASGELRNDAAAWVARKLRPPLASQLSSKPIEASTVKEWMDQYDCGANILDLFESEEKRRDFESCFAVPAAVDEDEDEESIDRRVRQWAFLRDHVPENKKGNSLAGLMGFMIQVYIGYHHPNFDRLLADLEEQWG
jgi:hypothetical protein